MKCVTARNKLSQRSAQRGYTIVELMMAIAVFAIGVSGIIAMQKVAAAANQHSRALSVATNIAQTWQDQLNADASLYTERNPLANTQLLSQAINFNNVWHLPSDNTNLNLGAAFDAMGNPLLGNAAANAQFCVHVRLTHLNNYPNLTSLDVIRTEIRVFWPRTDANLSSPFCVVGGMTEAQVEQATTSFHFVHQVSAVRQLP